MPSGNYGYDPEMLRTVISATNTAVGEMQSINATVTSLTGALPTVNNSTSGIRLAGLLTDWTTEYKQIITNLEVLNDKANGLLLTNVTTDDEASGATS